MSVKTLVEAVADRIPSRLELAAKLTKEHGKESIHNVTIESVMGGMRGIPCVLWEISETDAAGVKYHGKTLFELEGILPKWRTSEQLSPESILWFLYTATVPTPAQVEDLAADLVRRSELPPDVIQYCDSLPSSLPLVVQLLMSLAALYNHSKFTVAAANGVAKGKLWRHAFEDALDGTARVPMLVARIHANVYRQGRDRDVPLDTSADLAQNFARRMGRADDVDFIELTRLYWALHMDHGSSASAHTMRVCSSTWSDVYLTLSAGYVAATGQLHAMAITNAIRYNLEMYDALGASPTREALEAHILRTLEQGVSVPGYGHAVLRRRDPRLDFITRFVASRPASSPASQGLLALLNRANTLVPEVLKKHVPRMKNPAPNVDALSGCVLHGLGIEDDFLVPFMGCSRAMGFLVQLVWDKALGLPIERPLSITMEEMLRKLESRKEIQAKL